MADKSLYKVTMTIEVREVLAESNYAAIESVKSQVEAHVGDSTIDVTILKSQANMMD